jgi:hypothetical protein
LISPLLEIMTVGIILSTVFSVLQKA